MQQIGRFTSVALLVSFLSLINGCDRSGGQPGEEAMPSSEPVEETEGPGSGEELTILCGSSFRPPMEKLVELYEKETGRRQLMSFGGSEDHLPHVKQKAAGDLYVTHDPYMQYTKEAGALLRKVDVGFLAPVLVVRKGCEKNIKRIEDLAQPGIGVVLPNPEYSTCGEMVDKLLEKKGIKEAVLQNVGNAMMKHHSEIGNHLKLGSREAGIMWNGVAQRYLDAIEVRPTAYEYDDEIRVAVMGLSYSKKQQEVQKFLDFVEKHGPRVFSEFGYVKEISSDSP